MPSKNKPYEQFGPFILFRKLEADALGELWRAARVEGSQVAGTVALRRLTGGSRQALTAACLAAAPVLPQLGGTSFVRDQSAGVVGGVPYLSWDYAGGRSLRHIINAARGAGGAQPKPLPLDQAVVIAEKVALSLATTAELRDGTGARLTHGGLIPQDVWISDDGEIRVGGQLLGDALVSSLGDAALAAEIGRYFSPEYRASGKPSRTADVYAAGAIFFLLVTGHEPPDGATASAFGAAVRAAKTMTGTPIPDDIRVILDKSFNLDPSMRYPSMGDMRQALSALVHGGNYAATTFNLAFYLSSLLKHEMETEAGERRQETALDLAPYLAPVATTAAAPAMPPAPVPQPAPRAQAPVPPAAPMFASSQPKPKSRMPLVAIALVALAALGGGGYFMYQKSAAKPVENAAVAPASAAPVPTATQAPVEIPEPVLATPTDTTGSAATTTATSTAADAELQKKAFEDAVKAKLQAEMMKLQSDYMKELKASQSRNAPVAAAPEPAREQPAPTPAREERPALSASQLDQQRRDAATTSQPAPAAAAPAQAQLQPAVTAPAPAPVQAPTVREGDVVDFSNLDSRPRPLKAIRPTYPMLAMKQKIAATIILTAFVNENGEVTDVKVLRGEPRFGINDAAIRAMRSTRFSSPMKDGKRVRTWFPQTIDFRP